jgi:hypothetical protein
MRLSKNTENPSRYQFLDFDILIFECCAMYPIYSFYNALDPNDINIIMRDLHDCSQMGSRDNL